MKVKTFKLHALALFLAVTVIFVSPVAHAEERYVTDICASYAVWCDLFGIKNFDDETSISRIGSRRIMHMDNIDVMYDSETYKAKRVYFYCTSNLAMENSDSFDRLNALLAAVEFGKPDESRMETEHKFEIYLMKIKISVMEITDSMVETFNENEDSLRAGGVEHFYSSEKGDYFLTFSEDDGLTVVAYVL